MILCCLKLNISSLPLSYLCMYSIKRFLTEIVGLEVAESASDKIYCFESDNRLLSHSMLMKWDLNSFSFTLVSRGECRIVYNGLELALSPYEIFVYNPGLPVEILSVSEDYQAVTLLIKNDIILENRFARDFIKATYFPMIHDRRPNIPLPKEVFRRLKGHFHEIIGYQNSDLLLKTEASLMLFSLFLIDLYNALKAETNMNAVASRQEYQVIQFLHILPKYYLHHRSLDFYADLLQVSPVYLSRVVKGVTGLTVIQHVNQLLMSSAECLLLTTTMSVKEIAAQLLFADQATFSKFFKRLKGKSPTEYRRTHTTLS